MSKTFSITRYAAVDTSTLKLTTGDGETPMLGADEKTQLSITFHGPGSKEYAAATARSTNRVIAQMRRKGGKAEQNAEQMLRDEVERLVALTVSFNGPGWDHPDAAGETGDALYRAVYSDRTIGFIRDQAKEFVGDWENFTSGSATN